MIDSASLSGSLTGFSFGNLSTVIAFAGVGGGAAPSSMSGTNPGFSPSAVGLSDSVVFVVFAP
ncbi:MAG: hypothetical protein E6L04_08485 [Thaumarchaeota archaeon]|nr:MAG: hypothetical protein E6L04_08485 [Nitrososphaerota archaeon]